MPNNEPWNLGDGVSNVCNSVMRKLDYALFQLEERNRTIINLDSYEAMALYYAMKECMDKGGGRWLG